MRCLVKVKNLIVILGLLLSFNASAGISDVFYDLTAKILGEEKANNIFGRVPVEVVVPAVQLPEIPKIEKKNTDTTSTPESWNAQAADFNKIAPAEKRKYELAFLR